MKLWLSFFVLLLFVWSSLSLKCLDQNGEEIDWWVMLKAPKVSKSSHSCGPDGHTIAYLDANTYRTSSFKIWPSTCITDTRGHHLVETLNAVYAKSGDDGTGIVMYNDQQPDGKKDDNKAHSKGVAAWDKSGGFWLLHSVPGFPDYLQNGYSYPDAESIYGQSFICVSQDISDLDKAGINYQVNRPHFYEAQVSDAMANLCPNIKKAAVDLYYIKTPDTNLEHISTLGGKRFLSFSKNSQWNNDLYEALVEPTIGQGMWLETWMRPHYDSYCTPQYAYDSINVRAMGLGGYQLNWTEGSDHSKWGISEPGGGSKVACVGDINRNLSQRNRGGGTICTTDSYLYNAFYRLITEIDSC